MPPHPGSQALARQFRVVLLASRRCEVDYCVGNSNANTVPEVPSVNVRLDLTLGLRYAQ
jgi:hypothetical protein